MEEYHLMIHSLRYCCAMCFALLSFLLATSQRAQAQTREAYVAQSAGKTTLTFYYDALRATRAGTTWGILERKYVPGDDTYPEWTGISEEVDTTIARVVFDASFRDFRPTTTARWFSHCKALKQIEGLEYLNTSKVDDMSAMFCGCSALTSLDLQHFNTQNVVNMWGMFYGCSALTSLDLQHFNTQKVTYMFLMFEGCSALTSLDLKHFNTHNVANMRGMFRDCSALTSLDLQHFNTQKVIDMSFMFEGCSALTSLDLKHFNTQNVRAMLSMFRGCTALTSLDLPHFNTQKLLDTREMFDGCSSLTSLDLLHFDPQKVTDMSRMFYDCAALTTIHSNTTWQCQESKDMFAGCTKLKGAVAYDKNKVDAKMANPEKGYFTAESTTVRSR